jgi:hypothetical protein
MAFFMPNKYKLIKVIIAYLLAFRIRAVPVLHSTNKMIERGMTLFSRGRPMCLPACDMHSHAIAWEPLIINH